MEERRKRKSAHIPGEILISECVNEGQDKNWKAGPEKEHDETKNSGLPHPRGPSCPYHRVVNEECAG